jgi:hypothetical protein
MRSAVLLAAVVIGACTGVRTISLAEPTSEQERFVGDSVRTSGTVRSFVDPDGSRYYVLEDSADNRIQLLPPTAVARYDGRRVTVIGGFGVRPRLGRVVEVHTIDVP